MRQKLSDGFQEEFMRSLMRTTYEPNEIWLGAGIVGKELGMIETGAAIGLRDNGETRHVSKLFPEKSILLPGTGIFQGKPSKTHIRFLVETSVYMLSASALETLHKQYRETAFIIQFFMASETDLAEEYSFVLAHRHPRQRLAYVRKNYGDVFHMLTRDQQASFLGISTRTLTDLF